MCDGESAERAWAFSPAVARLADLDHDANLRAGQRAHLHHTASRVDGRVARERARRAIITTYDTGATGFRRHLIVSSLADALQISSKAAENIIDASSYTIITEHKRGEIRRQALRRMHEPPLACACGADVAFHSPQLVAQSSMFLMHDQRAW
ncbi:hypothetical protein C8R44DRAFT_869067 [Mycena epipterygia]|nr:hypothetical protein C8R44DRAFT_869067 [Mycena epipterygia]